MKEIKYRIPKAEKPDAKCVGMDAKRYAKAEQYFIDNGLVFSRNGGKTFTHTIHILRAQCAAWAEYAFGNKYINTMTNIINVREFGLAQKELDNLWRI